MAAGGYDLDTRLIGGMPIVNHLRPRGSTMKVSWAQGLGARPLGRIRPRRCTIPGQPGRSAHATVPPPSTVSVVPEMYEASSLTKKATVAAISSGAANRPSGVERRT